MNFVILISKKCIKMTNLFLVILFLVHTIFFFDILAQERSSSKGTLCVPTWCCGWHKHDSMVNFPPWGNEFFKPIESPDKMEMKENGTQFTHVALVYLGLLSLQNLRRLYESVQVSLCFRSSALRLLWSPLQTTAGDLYSSPLSMVCHALYFSSTPWSSFFPTEHFYSLEESSD